MADQEIDSKAYETQLFEALVIAQVPNTKAYTAVQEVRGMAGENQSSQFNTLNAKFDVLHAELNSKFSTAQASINTNRLLIHTCLGFMGTLIIVGVAILGFLFQIAHKL